jgi:hypothetical protein
LFGNVRYGQPVLPIDRTWLTLMLKEGPSGIAGSCAYKEDLFATGTLHRWLADYTTILAKAAAEPETTVGMLASGRPHSPNLPFRN